jgi:hypothetical protein
MEALLDYDGPWSPDLINLMVPVAEEAEMKASERQCNAVYAAAGSLFSNRPMEEFRRALAQDKAGIRRRQLAERGVEGGAADVQEDTGAQAAAALRKAFSGFSAMRASKSGRRR